MRRTFVIGDIHGAYRALRQCLDRSRFDYDNDYLICLGDVTDGWPETKASIDELIRIKNLTHILGNHDWWALQWMNGVKNEDLWFQQGGQATVDSYAGVVPPEHITYLANASLYHLQENKLFVHAGIDPLLPLDEQGSETFLWDRALAARVLTMYPTSPEERISTFDEIYIGHTVIPFPHPIYSAGVWLMDTGAGWSGVLSMMDINTREIFTSDPVIGLYPGVEGRARKQ